MPIGTSIAMPTSVPPCKDIPGAAIMARRPDVFPLAILAEPHFTGLAKWALRARFF